MRRGREALGGAGGRHAVKCVACHASIDARWRDAIPGSDRARSGGNFVSRATKRNLFRDHLFMTENTVDVCHFEWIAFSLFSRLNRGGSLVRGGSGNTRIASSGRRRRTPAVFWRFS